MDYLQTSNIDLDTHTQISELVTLSSPNKSSFSFLFEEWDNLDISYIDDQNIFSGDENSFQQDLSPQIYKRMDEVKVRRRKQTTPRKLIQRHVNCCDSCKDLPGHIMRIEEQILDLSNKNKEVLGLLEQKSKEFTSVVTLLKQVISNGIRHEVTSDAELTCKDVPGPSSLPETSVDKPMPAPRKSKSKSTGMEQNTCTTKSSRINVISDSIPRKVKDEDIIDDAVPGGCKEITRTIAYRVNDAIDHIQQQPDTNSPIIIHTGTNNIRSESSKRTIQRFQRLEVNLRTKGYQHVALSGIIFRGDHHNRRKTLAVNKEIENICIRNQWHFVDNGNIDITGISIDGLHLNRSGLDILTTNFKNVMKNFTKVPFVNMM